ncbi:MAG: hypothetical protein Q9219_006240 [cf. Caloplaca sp. 3 TL-2023]
MATTSKGTKDFSATDVGLVPHTTAVETRGGVVSPTLHRLLFHYTWPDGKVDKAIFHHHIRPVLLRDAEAISRWVHPQPCGTALDDQTAPINYPPDQLTWGFAERAHYPPINFVLERKGYKHPDYEVELWYYRGHLLLDHDHKPMKNFRHLPATISSKIPGGHIEALMRVDDRTTYGDIRARMPPAILVNQNGVMVKKPLKTVGALSAAAAKYREMAGCLNWHARLGSEVLNDYIMAKIPEEMKARNSSRGWRNLSRAEIAELRAPGIGSRPHQARKRANSTEVEEKRRESINARKLRAEAVGVNLHRGPIGPSTLTSLPSRNPDHAALTSTNRKQRESPRDKVPSDNEEIQALQMALRPTYMHLVSIIGVQPIKTELLSYKQQILNLQTQLNDTYPHLTRGIGYAPFLIRLTEWTGGIKDWRSARFWDGESYFRINADGGIGSAISGTVDSGLIDENPRAALAVENVNAVEEPELAAVGGHTSGDESDYTPTAGSHLVDGRGDRVDVEVHRASSHSPPRRSLPLPPGSINARLWQRRLESMP